MNYKILIIEDEKDTSSAVKEALALVSIDSVVAENGEEGLEKFKAEKFDLVLLDLKMPKMNGEEALKAIRKLNPYIDVIVYTNFKDFADIKSLTNIGIDGYINKGPEADLKELVSAIRERLEPMDNEALEKLLENGNPD